MDRVVAGERVSVLDGQRVQADDATVLRSSAR
jgi:hypothetical protein